MSILPMLRAAKIIRALQRAGLAIERQKGSHVQLRHPHDPSRRATVALHSKDISRKSLASILKQSRISVKEFLTLLQD